MDEKRQTQPVEMHGLDALTAALRDPATPVFRRLWSGKLQLLPLEEAARLASRGAHEALYCEVQT